MDNVRLRLFPFSLLGKAKTWFYTNKADFITWEACSNAFLTKYFPVGKTNALRGKISGFQQLSDEAIPEPSQHAPTTAWRNGRLFRVSSMA